MSSKELKDLTETVAEAVAFPLLTQETGRARRAGSRSVGVATSTSEIAQQTVHNVLGWRYREGDPRGFVAALDKAFSLREHEGHVVWDYHPQTFMVQADLGQITGAQASFLRRLTNDVGFTLPHLDGLTPQRPDVDEQAAEALRAIVRSTLNMLVVEMSQITGPRVQRVELFFAQLLGESEEEDAMKVEGNLGRLRDRFGFSRDRVNTVLDEQNFTNFLIVIDYVTGLRRSWASKRPHFVRNAQSEPYLGNQLIHLSQALDVILEQLEETYAGMDSVFFGAAERQTAVIPLSGHAPISVAELLDWVQTFAAGEGRRMIEEGGKDGIVSFRQTAELLEQLVSGAAQHAAGPATNPARGFHSKRVAILLDGLAAHVRTAHGLAVAVSRRPVMSVEQAGVEENVSVRVSIPEPAIETRITQIQVHERGVAATEPLPGNAVHNEGHYKLTLLGHGLRGASLSFESDIDIKEVVYESERRITALVDVLRDAEPGPYDLQYAGRDNVPRTFDDALVVLSPLDEDIAITSDDFGSVARGRVSHVYVTGRGLDQVLWDFGSDIVIRGIADEPPKGRSRTAAPDEKKRITLDVGLGVPLGERRVIATSAWNPDWHVELTLVIEEPVQHKSNGARGEPNADATRA